MENDHDFDDTVDNESDSTDEEYVLPGVPIVRSNTPRPGSFDRLLRHDEVSTDKMVAAHLSDFPLEAPSAPPLPEECDTLPMVEETPLPAAPSVKAEPETPQEYVWLFEYGLEMEHAVLNSPEWLDGQAFLYGPAVLKGYQLAFDAVSSPEGHLVATLAPSDEKDAEVWGILYRIPQYLIEGTEMQPAQLDKLHAAVSPDNFFERIEVQVQEAYHGRKIHCLTYVASPLAQQYYQRLEKQKQSLDTSYLMHLAEIARKQRLPEHYLKRLTALVDAIDRVEGTTLVQEMEQDTEPVSTVKVVSGPSLPYSPTTRSSSRGMVIFGLYVLLLLIAALTLAVVQGLGLPGTGFFTSFAPSGIPWFVLLYGLLGACVSSLVALSRYREIRLPAFVLSAWFARPWIGIVLAMGVYLLLHTGLFVLSANPAQLASLSAVLSLFAGGCEYWLFRRTA